MFLDDLGIAEAGLDRLIKASYDLVGLISFLTSGEDECRALDERVRAFLTSGVTGDEDYVIIDTAEYAIPGLDDDFRVIVSPWILSVLTTDRLARNYELVTKHNLKYRRYYHQFDY